MHKAIEGKKTIGMHAVAVRFVWFGSVRFILFLHGKLEYTQWIPTRILYIIYILGSLNFHMFMYV